MRIALFSDIHGNLTGLRAVLAAIEAAGGADELVAAGDLIVGESATDEVLDLLLARGVRLVRGDSDDEEKLVRLERQEAASPGSTRYPAAYYRALREWLRMNLSDAGRALLAGLPLARVIAVDAETELYVCHASPRAPDDRVCGMDCPPERVREAYAGVSASIIAFGHYHAPFVRWLDQRCYLNVASVGLRRDGRSCYTMLTYRDSHWAIEQRTVAYDVAAERRRMVRRKVPLPEQ
jgi:predicted phosphodiesterase